VAYTKNPPGLWPLVPIGDEMVSFAWSTFDVWPELLKEIEARCLQRLVVLARTKEGHTPLKPKNGSAGPSADPSEIIRSPSKRAALWGAREHAASTPYQEQA
jgi:hypothetical protein